MPSASSHRCSAYTNQYAREQKRKYSFGKFDLLVKPRRHISIGLTFFSLLEQAIVGGKYLPPPR
jgi:hypothetical protein